MLQITGVVQQLQPAPTLMVVTRVNVLQDIPVMDLHVTTKMSVYLEPVHVTKMQFVPILLVGTHAPVNRVFPKMLKDFANMWMNVLLELIIVMLMPTVQPVVTVIIALAKRDLPVQAEL